MPAEPKNRNGAVPIHEVLGELAVGDMIFTNGDGSFACEDYFMGTIHHIDGENISIKRNDNQRGEGKDSTWLVEATESNDAVVIFVDDASAIQLSTKKLKYGNIIKLPEGMNTGLDGTHLVVLQVVDEPHRLLLQTWQSSTPISVEIPDKSTKVKYYFDFFQHTQCSAKASCKNPTTFYVDGYHLCDEHKGSMGIITHCHDCHISVLTENAMVRTVRGVGRVLLCRACNQIRHDAEHIIKEHSFKPNPIFITVDPLDTSLTNKIFAGVENEVECPRNYPDSIAAKDRGDGVVQTIATLVIEKCNNPKPWFYLKSDGSLSNGFELVTHPATLKGHQSLNWRALTTLYAKYGVRADNTDTCGLHIHVNKSSMNDEHQKKLGLFVYRNQEMMEKIGRRSDCEYATYRNRANTDIAHMNEDNGVKYDALNWCPWQTVEFRLFKGSVDYKTLMSSIEFVHAAVMFTSCIPVGTITSQTKCTKAFKTFVDEQSYEFLPHYLIERGI